MFLIYGIDLGTTNSVLSLYDPKRKKSVKIGELLPSVVNMITGEVGSEQKESLCNGINTENIMLSFKVDITTDISGKPSVEASAAVLAELKKYMRYGEKDVVISVPAYFMNHQREATKLAAKKAGLNVVSLINEPTAAALYYLRESREKAVVFDLGGGTFDVTVVDTRYGISDVQATGGDRIGGDDLNSNIFALMCKECVFLRHKLPEGAERSVIEECEKLKIRMQKERKTIVFDFSDKPFAGAFESNVFKLTEEKYKNMLDITFGSTVVTMKKVIRQSGYSLDELKLILVGGSTRDPYLAEMVSEVKKPEPVAYNPDEIVAQGAAWFAYLKYLGKANSVVSDITKALGIDLLSGGVRSLIPPNSKIPITSKVLLRNSMDTDILTLNLLQGDSLTASKNTRIGQLIFHYAKPVKANRGMVCVSINISADGIIALKARESLSDEEVVRIESS